MTEFRKAMVRNSSRQFVRISQGDQFDLPKEKNFIRSSHCITGGKKNVFQTNNNSNNNRAMRENTPKYSCCGHNSRQISLNKSWRSDLGRRSIRRKSEVIRMNSQPCDFLMTAATSAAAEAEATEVVVVVVVTTKEMVRTTWHRCKGAAKQPNERLHSKQCRSFSKTSACGAAEGQLFFGIQMNNYHPPSLCGCQKGTFWCGSQYMIFRKLLLKFIIIVTYLFMKYVSVHFYSALYQHA